MDARRWQQIKDIFQEALEQEPAARQELIRDRCENDSELRSEVEKLLANHQQADRFIEKSALDQTPQLTAEGSSLVGRSLGAYRILRQIGQGGMSTVYLAERSDAQYRQQVAIKVIKLGMDSKFLIARFRQERQILANLDHPDIARLLDGGTLEDGRPYLVMEYIEGEPIDVYCSRQRLSIRQRLVLFRRVCDAAQYAHRNLVIHRDLKPSNILVTAEGQPKLLDFGTAKLLEPSQFDMPVTVTGWRLMTPEYASPEQLKAKTVTTASDVYALGVVLYKLLTGHRPYEIPSPLSPEAVRVVCEEEPQRPSTVAGRPTKTRASRDDADEETAGEEPATVAELSAVSDQFSEVRWRRGLEGDLDNIVLMALRKEPERRYASVEQLSEDLRRYLESLPVVARADTFGYRAHKFIRRHRSAVTAAVIVAVVLTGGVIATLWQAKKALDATALAEQHLQRARAQSEEAQEQRARAEAVSELLVDLFEVSDPRESRGSEITAREILDRGATRIQDELHGQPELQAAMLETIGVVYHKLGLVDEASELLEQALALQRDRGETLELASVLRSLGGVRKDQDRLAETEELLSRALHIRRALLGERHKDVAASIDDLGSYHYEEGAYEKAKEHYEHALTLWRDIPPIDEAEIANCQNNLGAALRNLGEFAAAERELRDALEVGRRVFGSAHPDLSRILNNLAATLHSTENYEEAEELLAEAVVMERKLRGGDHRDIATNLDNLALVQRQLHQLDEARRNHTEALEMRRRLLSPGHRDFAYSFNNLAGLYATLGDSQRAEGYYHQALAVLKASVGEQHPDARFCRYNFARFLLERENNRAAEREFRRLIELLEDLPESPAQELDQARRGLALARR